MVQVLLRKGAKSYIALFSSRLTPLMVASSRNALSTVHCLIGATDARLALEVTNQSGQTAADMSGNHVIRALLLEEQQRCICIHPPDE